MALKTFTISSQTLHIGPAGVVLKRGQKVESDGESVVRIGGKDYSVPAFASAIKVGWVVEGDLKDGGSESPSPNKPSVKDSKIEDSRIKMKLVKEEEGVVRSAIRPSPEPEPESAKVSHKSDDQVVVARFKTSTKPEKVEVGKDDRFIVDSIEKSAPKVERVKVAIGDVEETTFGDSLEEVLPNAEVAGKTGVKLETGVEVEEEVGVEAVEVIRKSSVPEDQSKARRNKAEVLSIVYPGVPYKFDAPWRNRAKEIVEAYQKSGDEVMLKAFLSIESESVKAEVEKGIAKSKS